MHNFALRRSIISLAHPLTILSVVILLVNDHLLRVFWPSWITGKLGDFAWLVFAPLILAIPLSFIVPKTIRKHDRAVGISSIAIVAVVFGLAKTLPNFHAMTTQLIEAILGWPSTLKRDPTDLVALPALLITWNIWRRDYEQAEPIVNYRGWAVLALAMLATVANTPAEPEKGITCLYIEGSTIEAPSRKGTFASQDGGLSWSRISYQDRQWDWCPEWDEWDCCFMDTLVLEDQDEIQYRFTPGRSIERSEDGGNTWIVEFELSHQTEAQRATYISKYTGSPWPYEGPIEAIEDMNSGSIVVSMGLEGVLVREAGGEWRWVTVGPYERIEPQSSQVYTSVLTDEFIISAILVVLLLGTTIRFIEQKTQKRFLFPVVVWLLWVCLIYAVKEETDSVPFIDLGLLLIDLGLLPLTCILSLILIIRRSTVDFFKRSIKAFMATVLSSLVGGILFLVPYILWVKNSIQEQSVASSFAMIMGIGMLLVTFGITKGVLEKDNGKDTEETSDQEGE